MASVSWCQAGVQSSSHVLSTSYITGNGGRAGKREGLPCCGHCKGRRLNAAVSGTRCSLSEDNLPGKNPENLNDRLRSKLDALYYTKTDGSSAPVENSAEHTRLTMSLEACEKDQDLPPCPECEAAGQVQCGTCKGSGLYVEPILESQGIIKLVKCLGCGGSGIIMCLKCGGWGHVKDNKAKEESAAS